MTGTNHATGGLRRITRLGSSAKLGLAGFILVVALGLALIGWIKGSMWSRLERLESEFATIKTENFYLGVHLRGGMWQLNNALLRFQLSQNPAERDSFQKEARLLRDLIGRTKAHLTTPGEKELVRQVEAAFHRYLADTAELLERRSGPVRKDTSAQLHAQIVEKSEPLLALSERLVQAQQSALSQFFVGSKGTMDSLQRVSQGASLLMLVFVILIAALLHRVLVTPLRAQLTESQAVIERQEKLASLGTLAAGVAHEIRNPLTAIKLRLFSLKKALPAAMATNEDVVIIHNEINRLEKIVKDFLHFARPTAPELANVPAGQILQEVQALLKTQLDKHTIALKLEPSEPAWLHADKNQIAQVLINLIQNSADSIGRNGAITLRARPGAAHLERQLKPVVHLEVADTGQGIPPDAEQRIFDPFFSTKEGSTGLGLPIAARIVEKHGGFIQYQSRTGHGTTFSIVLPRITPDVSQNSPH